MSVSTSVREDEDPQETQEWLDALTSVYREEGADRAHYLLQRLMTLASGLRMQHAFSITTPYRNTIPTVDEAPLPGNVFMDRRVRSLVRWNALAMVMRANLHEGDLGGHIATFSSGATLYDIGFDYFFRAATPQQESDLIYFQGHSAPGIYARAFLEGRLSEEQLDNFRREVDGKGLSSYPHPWLMPEFWQFPTVSMGLGAIQSIYQAHFMKYLSCRGLLEAGDRKVWAFLGDGEMDEPESLGAISLAGREKLDNLIFVVNCNLQRLDGPVRGNGKIIQELEGVFRGAGWNVIKVVWGKQWDPLFEKDTDGLLQQRMNEVVDGEYQNYKSKGGAYTREHFFGKYPELLKRVEHLSDEDIYRLNRGGHDPYKVYAAYHEAVQHKDRPTVILAKTIKGYGLGVGAEGENINHSVKKLGLENLKAFRDRFDVPITDEELPKLPFYRPPDDSPEITYLRKRREELGGFLPKRRTLSKSLTIPSLDDFKTVTAGSDERAISTTMAFVRILSSVLAKDKNIGERIVPIVPDEARTFGMEGMFRQLGIYSSEGQLYKPNDSDTVMFYREDKKGQILEEGINEAGAFSAWLAAGTSYSCNNFPMIPFFVFYSMFGFQRVGDLAWAAGDSQARGFLIGATSGRTTLNGEGLQHQDGHSHLLASVIPNCVAYDPAFAYELAVIIQNGLYRMYQQQEGIFYYITTLNENYVQPPMPDNVQESIIKGMYLYQSGSQSHPLRVQLLGSGAILREVLAAADILKTEFNITADVWSVTSFNELRRNGLEVLRWNMLHPEQVAQKSYVEQCLENRGGPVIASTDYIKTVADQIRAFIPDNKKYIVLGTDGFGRSDTREQLRRFFEIDRYYVVVAALYALAQQNEIAAEAVSEAIKRFNIDPHKINPLYD